MGTNEMVQKKGRPQIVKLDNALELAKRWVNNMTEPAEDEPIEIVSRPARLGLGAKEPKVPRPSKFLPSDDPLERKLHYKLEAERRKAAKVAEEFTLADRDDDDDEEGLDSRTNAFEKKRAADQGTRSLQAKKKQK